MRLARLSVDRVVFVVRLAQDGSAEPIAVEGPGPGVDALRGLLASGQDLRDACMVGERLVAGCRKSSATPAADVIATGTPVGVGFARRPPVFLRDGDVVGVDIEGIGTLRNSVVVEH